jgi:hypothetical protein
MQPPLTLSTKNTKTEILAAYDQLLEEMKTRPAEVPLKKAEVQRTEEQTTVYRVSQYTVEHILRSAADLKLNMSQTLDALVNRLAEEASRLIEIQAAIAIEQKQLQEIHNIQIAADTLQCVVDDIEKRKKEFDSEMELKQKAWDEAKQEHEREEKEYREKMDKNRAREEEEYGYTLSQKRKKDEDAYEIMVAERKRVFEAEQRKREEDFLAKEKVIVAREEEYEKLKSEVEGFPEKLSRTIETAREETRKEGEKEAKVSEQLLTKGMDGERALFKAQVESLQQMVQRQSEQIDALKRDIEGANKKSQELATKVIEGASQLSTLHTLKEMGLGSKERVDGKQ